MRRRGALKNVFVVKFLHLCNMEKISQENAFDTIEPIESNETTIDINNLSSETKDDILSRTEQHRENIDEIIVPQYIQYINDQYDDQYVEGNYAVTYSKKDNSLLGWTINIEQNGQQLPHVYFKLDQSYDIMYFRLCKKTLLFCYREHIDSESYDYCMYLF